RYRTILDLVMLASITAWRLWPRVRKPRVAAGLLVGFLALEFLMPFDISLVNRPGAPSIRSLQMGLQEPRAAVIHELEAAAPGRAAEVGGCVVVGNEPRWILVW